jgi:phosphatidyl-myo-inositol alpha-mannosyltransferase
MPPVSFADASCTLERPLDAPPGSVSPGRASPRAKVLHLINGEHYSGAERVQDLLAARLPEFGFDVGFACIKPGCFDQMRQAKHAPLVQLPMRSRFDMRPVAAVARLLRRGGYTLLHTHSPRAALIGRAASAMAAVPMIHHIHSPTGNDTANRWRDRFNATAERASLWGVAAVIAVSRSLGAYARGRGIDEQRIAVVPNGVPCRGPLPRRATPSGVWTLGAVALYRPRKGLEVLLDALVKLRSQGLPVRLRAVGTFECADYEAKIKARVEQLGLRDLIDWRGFQREVNQELAAMDLFVLPSLFGEGLPMVILEAMAAGVPVIGTRVEGVPEALRDGQDGLIAAPGDAADLARAIEQVVRGAVGWAALRETAHQRQAEHFSDASMSAGVAAVYNAVLARRC